MPDFARFGAPDTGDFPAHLREDTVGRREPVRQAQLEDDLRRLTMHLDRIDSDPDLRDDPQQLQTDLRDLHRLLDRAQADCQFAGRELTGVRATALMGAVWLRASGMGTQGELPLPVALRSWRGEMRSMLEHAVKTGAEGVTTNGSDCLLIIPFAQRIPPDFPAAVRDRDAHLAALTRAAPERSRKLPGHDALCTAKALLQSLPSSDVLDGEALPRWQSALAGALALETEAFAAVRHQRAQASEAIRHLMAHHDLPRAP
ncbi:hypothetical protein [Roseateles sp.]|uniref:hypothetical protein n=1 Tax=Roseateles sp. TaxID=1971397 RepID=UPI002F3EA898